MLQYSTEQLSTIIALPVITTLLAWTVAIFHKNRKKWGPYDIPIVSVLILSILRNVTILSYTLVLIFTLRDFGAEYCSIVTWLFNSIHTFQASSLTTIAVIGLFSAKLYRKNQNLRVFLTPTHIIYHLFCLTTLCACVGVAAILAQKEGIGAFGLQPCNFLPFELDVKFNIFIIVLHVFLASIAFVSFALVCYNYYKIKKDGFDYIKKSNSDLSELSNNFHGINTNVHHRHYYDTYTIHRNENNNFCNNNKENTWCNSEILSNISTTVSSTNSRRPCIARREDEEGLEARRTGLETMHPVLIVCYLFYHLPLMILSIFPRLVAPWPVAGIALWLGLVQDLLIPIGLGIVDSRFCRWVSDVYRCSAKNVEEKLPQVGLDGKFRPFGLAGGGGSQPHSLEIVQQQQQHGRNLQTVEHRFPITNGSLYTSIDGRLPVIHNYRRHTDSRTVPKTTSHQDLHSSSVALHSTYLKRKESDVQPPYPSSCQNCATDLCPSHSNLHHLSPHYVNKKPDLFQNFDKTFQNSNIYDNGRTAVENIEKTNIFLGNDSNRRRSQSQEDIFDVDRRQQQHLFCNRSEVNIHNFNLNSNINDHMVKNSRNLLRLSKSEDSLNGLQVKKQRREVGRVDLNTRISSDHSSPREDNTSTLEDQYSSDENEHSFLEEAKDYDSLSSSNNSITTDACNDFQFFQSTNDFLTEIPRINAQNNANFNFANKVSEKPVMSSFKPFEARQMAADNSKNFKISRRNSQKSLEDLQVFVEENNDKNRNTVLLERSFSYTTLEDRRKKRRNNKKVIRSNSKLSDCGHSNFEKIPHKIKSVEYLPDKTTSTVYIEDLRNNNGKYFVGTASVPDFKKVFISDYL